MKGRLLKEVGIFKNLIIKYLKFLNIPYVEVSEFFTSLKNKFRRNLDLEALGRENRWQFREELLRGRRLQ